MAVKNGDTLPLRIGLNTEFRSNGKKGDEHINFSVLDPAYSDRVWAVACVPVIVPLIGDRDLPAILDKLDGIILTGSRRDLDPRNDGFRLHPTTQPLDPIREKFDRALVRRIRERKMPVLGIGGGMQLLNVAGGGTLGLHIPDDWPRAKPHITQGDDREPTRHALEIEPDSLIERAYRLELTRSNKPERPIVPSEHHQAVDDCAEGFRVTARCPNGIIEAIESTDRDWLAVGVQWHPEAPNATRMDWLLFETWANEVRLAQVRKTCGLQLPAPAAGLAADDPKREFSRPQAATYLHVGISQLRRRALKNKRPLFFRRGGTVIYTKASLDDFLAEEQALAGPELPPIDTPRLASH
jgi:putative glutamine amidotransferase